jgi:hypothetical protein
MSDETQPTTTKSKSKSSDEVEINEAHAQALAQGYFGEVDEDAPDETLAGVIAAAKEK